MFTEYLTTLSKIKGSFIEKYIRVVYEIFVEFRTLLRANGNGICDKSSRKE